MGWLQFELSHNIWASVWKVNIFETVIFEHFYLTRVEAVSIDVATLV